MTVFDLLIVHEKIQGAGYPLEAEDAVAAWEHGATDEPVWYMKVSPSIRQEIERPIGWCTDEYTQMRLGV